MTFQVGQTVGNYKILRKLGSGGMGQVYLAHHPVIGKSVALKVIHSELSQNTEVVTRFVNEARAVSTIHNEHIVDVHDFGTHTDGAHFFVMEYLDGKTLAQVIPSLSTSDALHVGAQIAAGLAAAHQVNIVHRDLKPDNIMLIEKLGDPLFVKILDFGLAKMLEGNQKLTNMGVVLGTPEYMSPEAAESKIVDARSDIYSFGILLFHMFTGQLPFVANSMGEMMMKQVFTPAPSLRAYNPSVSPAIEQIVLRCLTKAKDDRFASMAQLHAALRDPDAYARGGQPAGKPVLSRPKDPKRVSPSMVGPGLRPAQTTPAPIFSRPRTMGLALIALFSATGGAAAALQGAPSMPIAESRANAPAAVNTPKTPSAASAIPAIQPQALTPQTPAVAPATEETPDDAAQFPIEVITVPTGAVVTDSAGHIIGTTPFTAQLATDKALAWRFRAEGFEPMLYQFVPRKGRRINLILTAKPAIPSPPALSKKTSKTKKRRGKASKPKPRKDDFEESFDDEKARLGNGVMAPEF